ncbi:MAG: hypothetical protein ACQETG_03510, partial [Thermodesulfobacteriota bacterium]
ITPMKNLSPRVVSIGKKPFLATDGEAASHKPIKAIAAKRPPIASPLCQVQYIQEVFVTIQSHISYTLPRAKPLAM